MTFSIRLSTATLASCLLLNSAFVVSGQQPREESRSTVLAQPYFTEPSLSPDRKEIAFVSGGDIWTVPSSGGVDDFTEGYRALKLGRVVGEPTAGWIIYTWNQSLIVSAASDEDHR